ncbi:Nif11-like leader peptide family natural product precursor [Nostoc sp. CHAB 5784]|uniref:Nif11-like leader peptide family natural product precursor n=1 Tax=Nostoc mirabile TaxID=2907820 RepID=UPI001E4AE438|nr:Nif11-like leader peptide family natural product precursor [Nostoc mirabile]MCC5666858.1 Nif11-like leader peptide family natural product precursor [Nostoc mirabile CHAB5784]
MAKEEVTRLFRSVQANVSLREKLNSAPSIETFVQLAQDLGYNFTVQEWKEVTSFNVEELKCKVSEIPGI